MQIRLRHINQTTPFTVEVTSLQELESMFSAGVLLWEADPWTLLTEETLRQRAASDVLLIAGHSPQADHSSVKDFIYDVRFPEHPFHVKRMYQTVDDFLLWEAVHEPVLLLDFLLWFERMYPFIDSPTRYSWMLQLLLLTDQVRPEVRESLAKWKKGILTQLSASESYMLW